MILPERFIILCFLTQVTIGLSYAQSEDQDDTITKPADDEINSEENKIENGPFFFKINTKRNKPHKPFTLPILEIPNYDGFDQKTAWEVYNNEKTFKEKEYDKDFEEKDKEEDKFLEADDVISNESTSTIVSEEDRTTPESTSSTLGKILVEPIHRSTYSYFYKPIDSSRTSGTSSTIEKDGVKDYIGTNHNAFSSLGFGYSFLDNMFSFPGSNMRTQASPKIHNTHHEEEEDQSHSHGFSSPGFGYPFINNFHSFLDEEPIKRAVTKVKIFSTNFEKDQPTEQEETEHPSSSHGDGKKEGSIKIDEEKDDNVKQKTKLDGKFDGITLTKGEAHQQSANVEEILSSIMPIYDWATSSLLNINMNQDILNIGRILRNGYYNSLTKETDKKEEHQESQLPTPDILPDVEKYGNSEPHSFIEEVMDEINTDSESNRELNIERPPTDSDLPDIGSEDSKNIKPRSPAKCICGFSQGSTNSCSCFPETLVYYQYCSVPIPPTD